MPNIQHHLYKIEVHPIYSHQNMTQQCQKWPLQNHCRAKWGLSKCIFKKKNTMLNLLFCRQSWGLNWWPCTGSRGVSTSLFCRENDHRDYIYIRKNCHVSSWIKIIVLRWCLSQQALSNTSFLVPRCWGLPPVAAWTCQDPPAGWWSQAHPPFMLDIGPECVNPLVNRGKGLL